MSTFLNRIREYFTDVLHIWRNEMIKVIKDEGVLMFLVVVPLGYPLLYSWIYNNETLHETPVVVVDQSHSALSRQFIKDCDATPDVQIKYYAEDLDEARSLISRQLVRGIYLIPSDFAERVNRGEQATVSVYCDMSLMLAYKNVYQTAMVEAGRLGAGLNIKKAGNYSKREDAITAQPLAVDGVAMFNPSGGYGSCVLPGVLMILLQQAIALGIGMAAGTARQWSAHSRRRPALSRRLPHCLGQGSLLQHDWCRGRRLPLDGCSAYVRIPATWHWMEPVLAAPALHHGQHLLRNDCFMSGALPRECHAHHGIRIRAPAFPDRCFMAAVQHSQLLAGRLLAFPQHLWCACFHPRQLHGSQHQSGPSRAPHSLDSGCRLSRHGLPCLSPPVPVGEEVGEQLDEKR